jgi:hypothetical protein
VLRAPSASSSASGAPGVITAVGGHDVNPVAPVKVSIANGKLTSVAVLNPDGKHVRGAIDSAGTTWQNSEVLGYSKTYRIVAKGVGEDGAAITERSRLTTLTPNNITMPYLQRIGEYSLDRGATYGVGIVPEVNFDEPIANKAAAERALQVTTTPHVDGSWYWASNHTAHYRPKEYWRVCCVERWHCSRSSGAARARRQRQSIRSSNATRTRS